MGARKGKGCRTNIWILNGIIHENAKKKTKKPIVLQFYDYQQMFDSVNLKQAVNDLFDYGVTDDCLQLLFKANEEIFMSVKTPGGLTDRQKITNSVLQGDTWGPMFAVIQVDKICKSIEETGIGYQYKNLLPITMLGLVDDLVGVTEAGNKAQQMNVILNPNQAGGGQICPTDFQTLIPQEPKVGLTSNQAVNSSLSVVSRSKKKIDQFGP